MSHFRPIESQTEYLLPPSVQDWLPESHLARYVVDVVEGLDLSELERPTRAAAAMRTTLRCCCRC